MRPRPPATPGIPRAIGKGRRDTGLPALDQVRESWLLELLGWQRHGQVPARLELHGRRSSRPPVLLLTDEHVICLDFLATLHDLRSRPRAFSQQAGRYAEAVHGALASRRALVLELWDLEAQPTPDDEKLAAALSKYLRAAVTLHGPEAVGEALAGARFPAALCAANPLAWGRERMRAP